MVSASAQEVPDPEFQAAWSEPAAREAFRHSAGLRIAEHLYQARTRVLSLAVLQITWQLRKCRPHPPPQFHAGASDPAGLQWGFRRRFLQWPCPQAQGRAERGPTRGRAGPGGEPANTEHRADEPRQRQARGNEAAATCAHGCVPRSGAAAAHGRRVCAFPRDGAHPAPPLRSRASTSRVWEGRRPGTWRVLDPARPPLRNSSEGKDGSEKQGRRHLLPPSRTQVKVAAGEGCPPNRDNTP